ncbi:2-dehydropantoate 2-reductase [Sinobacterium caligoides]|uniref:2-dehydropantoate 2-reductase n=1 Tax=Sinobacterium caligoides TaxID=933926 RepID=A0A3N2DNL7_9GAMM|nr:2-dehydropantoate 2-reductase [Sinobacterium caligoides]ROS01282.1 2-dehydropantoate 2-reductase [Sinobacterium caligoides]
MQHWVIIGGGAIGCLWAASLQQQHIAASLVVRNNDALTRYRTAGGISLQRSTTTFQCQPTAYTAVQYDHPIDRLIIATKAQHTAQALASVASRLTDDCIILSLQNGMGQQQHILDHYPNARLYCGVSTDGAYLQSPFHVVHAGAGTTRIGRYPENAHDTPETSALIAELPTDVLTICADQHIERQLWQKLAINCLINPLTALYRCHNGELINHPQARPRLEQLAEELDRIIAAEGLAELVPAALSTALNVAKITAANRSSMFADVLAGRDTEINFITGYLCQRAAQHNIKVPCNQKVLDDIRLLKPNA